jgi:hypothetical protein
MERPPQAGQTSRSIPVSLRNRSRHLEFDIPTRWVYRPTIFRVNDGTCYVASCWFGVKESHVPSGAGRCENPPGHVPRGFLLVWRQRGPRPKWRRAL